MVKRPIRISISILRLWRSKQFLSLLQPLGSAGGKKRSTLKVWVSSLRTRGTPALRLVQPAGRRARTARGSRALSARGRRCVKSRHVRRSDSAWRVPCTCIMMHAMHAFCLCLTQAPHADVRVQFNVAPPALAVHLKLILSARASNCLRCGVAPI